MKIQRMPEDIVPLLNDLVRRITALETRPLGTVFINESLIIKDPDTGVETIIGNLEEYGEDRKGIKQWVNDTEPPAVPVMPIVTSNLGVFSVIWSGFFEDDAPMAPDFSHLNVYGNNGTSTQLVGVIKTKDEVAIVTSNSEDIYADTWSFWFTSVDQVGNESLPGEISVGNKLTPLVEAPDIAKILDEIDEKFGGVITEAQQLNDKLAQAELGIDNAQTDLIDLETVRLPAVEADIEAAHQEIASTGAELGARLDQAETDLNAAESGLDNLKNTELPALKQRLADAEADITASGAELSSRLTQAESDLSAHDTRIGQNESNLTTLNNTTLPALNTELTNAKNRLTTAEGELSATKNRVTTAEGTLNTLKNTTIPALNTDLSNAKSRLTTAETEITGTKTRLTDAESDLTDAFGQITAVDTKAGNAQTAASNAQTAADSANTAAANAAGIAGSKGKVLVQSTAPAVADRNAVTLWIDTTGGANTPKRWTSGTTWVAVTDKAATDAAQAAVTAQARADSAHTAAGNAQSTADSALSMAGSKNKVFYSTSNPSGTASVGDTWRKVNASNDVIAEWRWTAGNTWLTQQITSEVISNLDVGKLTAGSAIINTAVVNKIAIQTADVIKLNASAITAGTISADRLNVNDLAAKIATVIQLNADRITAGTIATGRLNATEVAAAVANVIQLNASRITAGTINTDRLNANEIAAKVATVIQLNASRITAGTISTDRLDVNDIAAKTASFQTVDVKNLFATSGTMSEAVINKLWTDVVRSRKITTDQILVGRGANLIPFVPGSVEPHQIQSAAGAGGKLLPHNDPDAGGWAIRVDAPGVTPGSLVPTMSLGSGVRASNGSPESWDVVEGQEYFLTIGLTFGGLGTAPNVRPMVRFYDGTGGHVSDSHGTTAKAYHAGNTAATWEGKVPVGATALRIYVYQDQPTQSGSELYLSRFGLYRKQDASLIVDGTIAAKHIDSESVSAEVAKFIDLDVSRLVATNATMNTAVINKLWADVIRARKITTDMMVVGSGGNHFPDPLFTDPDGWSYPERITKSVGRNGGNGVVIPASTGQIGMYYGSSDRLRQMPVIGGQEYRVGVWVKSSVAIPLNKVTIYVKYTTPSSAISGSFATNIQNTGVDGRLGVIPANTWRFLEGIVKMPDTAEQAFIGLFTESGFNAAVTFSEPSVQTAAGTGLIVDGAIEAKHITASESMSAKIGQFLKLDVKDLVTTGSSTMNQAVIDKLWTDVVHSKKITSDMVVIGGTNNVLVDTFFEDEDFKAIRNSRSDIANGTWGVNPTFNLNWYGASNQPTDRSKNFYFLASSGNADKNAFIPVEPGSKWRLKAKTNSAGSGARFTARFIRLDGSTGYTGISSFSSTGIVDHSEVWTIPSDFAYVQLAIQFNTPCTSCYVYGGASMVQMSSGELIVDGAITADKIKSNAVESDKIKSNAITADKIDVGAIKAEHISARGITADKLVVGDGSNVFPDSFMKDLDSWNAANNVTVYTGGYGGGNRARVNGTTGQTGGYYAFGAGLEGRRPDVIPGRSYLVSCYVRPTVAVSSTNAIALFSRLYKKGDPFTASYSFTSPSVVYNGKALAANVWTEISGQITIPTGDRTSYMPGLYLQSTFPSTGDCDFSMFTLTEMTTGSLIVNGAIDGKTITGNTINGAAIIGGYIRMDGGPEVWQPSIRMSTDALGAYLGFGNVGDGTMGTIRAHNESGTAGPSNVRLELKSPSATDALRRSHVTLYSGWDVGNKHEVAKKPWVDMDSDIEFSDSTTISTYNNGDLKFIARGSDLRLSSDTSQGAFVQSNATYARTYSTSAAMCITGSGVFGRTISALKYKQDVETVNPEDYGDLLLSIDHKSWIDKSEAERYSEYVTWEREHPNQPIPEEMMEYPTKEPSRHYGAIADDFHNAGLGQYVHYDTNGEVDGLAYDRIGVALIPLVREQRDKIRDLEARLEALEGLNY